MGLSYRSRLAIKRYPLTLDRDEIGVVFDNVTSKFFVCPPDLSSKSLEVLTERWLIFFKFISLVPSFDATDLDLTIPIQREAYQQALGIFREFNTDQRLINELESQL
jgi:hypothetical protein